MQLFRNIYSKYITPISKDSNKRHKEFVTRVVVGSFTIALVISSLVSIALSIGGIFQTQIAIIVGICAIVLCIATILIYHGRWKYSAFLLFFVVLGLAVWGSLIYELSIINLMAYTLALIIAALLLDIKCNLFFLLLIITLNIMLSYGGTQKYLGLGEFSLLILSILVYYPIIDMLLLFYTRQLYKALNNSETLAEELKSEIKKQKKTEKSLKTARSQAEASKKSKEDFFAKMSHEIRNPLNAVTGLTNLLKQTRLSRKQKQYVNNLKLSSENLLVIINDILGYSKIEAGTFEVKDVTFDLKEFLSTIVVEAKILATEKKLKIKPFLHKNLPKYVIGDSVGLYQILINIITNAIKSTKKGSIEICAGINNEEKDTVEIYFKIKDTGEGITRKKLGEILQDYHQKIPRITTSQNGTGLGLMIVKLLVKKLNGKMEVESKVNQGSTFSILIPLKKTREVRSRRDRSSSSKKTKSCSVLLAEDDKLNQIVAHELLKKIKAKVTLAATGKEVIEKLKKNNFDIVLMDILMPDIDGIHATKIIRTKFKSPKRDIPIIAVSAYAQEHEIKEALKAGANDYISKPFTPDELYKKIEKNLK